MVYGIPTFLVGAILVFRSKQPIRAKLFTILTPIVLYFPFTYLFLNLYNFSTPKTILIPKYLEGNLRVVYEEKCGRKYDKTDGAKTLTFPENGILVLNEDFDSHINYNYYLVDEFGSRSEIPQILAYSDTLQRRPCVLVGGSGTIGQTIEANSTNQEKKGITYADFYVYNINTLDRNDYKSQLIFDSLTTVIVNQCRQQK